jgi:ADP-ribosyl-[dinitrogen reductase] hydrolase
MRNLPVALATLGDPTALVRWTIEQCHITHHHVLSDAATVTLGRMVQRLLLGGGLPDLQEEAATLVEAHRQFHFDPYPGRASAYIVDTVQTVLYYVLKTRSFEECLVQVVNRGDDADTTGALAGMLCGARYGVDAIPSRWLRALEPATTMAVRAQVDGLLALAPAGQSGK